MITSAVDLGSCCAEAKVPLCEIERGCFFDFYPHRPTLRALLVRPNLDDGLERRTHGKVAMNDRQAEELLALEVSLVSRHSRLPADE